MKIYWSIKSVLRGLGMLCLLGSFLSACGSDQANTGSRSADTRQAETPEMAGLTDPVEDTADSSEAKNGTAAAPKTVLDYFRDLPAPYALPYSLAQKDRLWYAIHLPSGQERQAMVDLENGYIEFSHLPNDTASERVQVALLRLSDGQAALGACQTTFQADRVAQNCFVVRPGDNRQYDWTEHTLPVITAYEFFSDDTPELDSEYLEDAFPILLKLPQYGGELVAEPYLGRRFYYCGEEAAPDERRLCPLFDQLERRAFRLNWNPVTGRFE